MESVNSEPSLRHETVTHEQLREMLRMMLLVRHIDVRSFQLNRQGKIPFALGSEGHEAVQAGAGLAMRRGRDLLYPYYRDTGLCLAFGLSTLDVFHSLFGNRRDRNGGRQFPSHWTGRHVGIASVSSILAAHTTHAVGAAYAIKLRRQDDRVVLCSFGEGTTSEGEWHEALNFASIQRLPIVMLCQNNGWAISTPQSKQMAVADVAARAEGYGMPGVVVDGMDPVAVYEQVAIARERAAGGRGPTLVEAKCYRFRAHSTDDDDRTYRSRDEVAEIQKQRDPVNLFVKRLAEEGIMTAADIEDLKRAVLNEVNECTDLAEAEPPPAPEDLYVDVVEGDWRPWQ